MVTMVPRKNLPSFSLLLYLVGISFFSLVHHLPVSCDLSRSDDSRFIPNASVQEGYDLSSSLEFSDKWITTLTGWERVTDLWPTGDAEKTQFFFNGDSNAASKDSTICFTESFIGSMKPAKCVVEIEFSVWMKKKNGASDTPTLNLSGGETKVNLFKQYQDKKFDGKWMPYSLRINSERLVEFKIQVVAEDLFVAFRKFQVKYTTFVDVKNPKTTDPVKIDLKLPNDNQTQNCTSKSEISTLDGLSPSKTYCRPALPASTIRLDKNSIESLDQVCIEFDYHFSGKKKDSDHLMSGNLEVFYALEEFDGKALVKQSVTSIQLTDSGKLSDLNICLGNYLSFTAKNYSIYLQLNSADYLNLYFSTSLTSRSTSTAPIDFLLPFGDNSTQSTANSAMADIEAMNGAETVDELWHSQWNDDYLHFADFFELKQTVIHFTAMPLNASHQARLSTKWIHYTASLGEVASKYTFRLTNPKLPQNLKVYPQVCNQLGQCSQVALDKNPDTNDYSFHLPEIKTDLFRLEFIFEYTKNETEISVDFRLIDSSHPCYGFDGKIIATRKICSHNGLCVATRKTKTSWSCKCPTGYSGEICDTPDPCLVVPSGKTQTGGDTCGHLGCQKVPNSSSFNCICAEQTNNRIAWNGTQCLEVKPEPQEGLSFPHHLDQHQTIVYKFNSSTILPSGYDFCFNLAYNLSLAGSKESSFDQRPTINVKLDSVTLFRDPMSLQTSSLKFCLNEFILEKILHQKLAAKDGFKVEFTFEALKPSKDSTKKFTDYKATITSINIKMVEIKDSVSKKLDSVNEYNRFYEKNLQFSGWRLDLFNQDNEVKHSVQVYVEPTKNEPRLKIQSLASKPILVTLISNWFISNSHIDSISLHLHDNSICPTSGPTVSLSARILYSTKSSEMKSLDISLVKNGHDFKLDSANSLKELVAEQGALFKVILEIQSICSELEFTPITVGSVDLCKDRCQGPGAKCTPNFKDGSFKCDCKNTGRFGDTCEKVDACQTNTHCSTMPGPKNSHLINQCIPTGNNTSACACWPGVFEWNPTSLTCNPTFHQEHKVRALDQTDAYLKPLVSYAKDSGSLAGNLIWMNRTEYWSARQNLSKPFYMDLQPDSSKLSLTIPSLLKDKDFCLNLTFYLTGNTQIGISSNNTHLLWFSSPSDQKSSTTKICLRELMNFADIDKDLTNYQLDFTGKYTDDSMKQLIALQVESGAEEYLNLEKIKPEKSVIESKSIKSYFPLRIPDFTGFWTVTDNAITFKKPATTHNSTSISYILSSWFETNSKLRKEHTLRFKLGKSAHLEGLKLEPVIFNSKMEDITIKVIQNFKKINYTNLTQINNLTLLSNQILDDHYRFGFKLITADKANSLSITSLDLDDFCQLLPKDKFCSSHGSCQVNSKADRGYDCTCNTGYGGKDCDKVNYCKLPHVGNDKLSGAEVCKKAVAGECKEEKYEFSCDCKNNSAMTWRMDLNPPQCKLLPLCPTDKNTCDPVTEICTEPTGNETKVNCTLCAPGYRRSDSMSPCRKVNPCDDNKAAECGRNTDCLPVFGTFKNNDVPGSAVCYCQKGFVKDKDTSKDGKLNCRKYSVCDSPWLSPCDQICKPVGNHYKCECYDGYKRNFKKKKCELKETKLCKEPCNAEKSFCDIKEKECKCQEGFDYNFKPKTNTTAAVEVCKPKNDAKFVECPNGKVVNDPKSGKPECQCDGLYELDGEKSICKLKPICSEKGEGFKKCSKQNALCVLTDKLVTQSGTTTTAKPNTELTLKLEDMYTCRCKPGQHWFVDSKTNQSICGDLCADSIILAECGNRNAVCNLLASDAIDPNSKVDPSKVDWNSLCRCKEGYVSTSNSTNLTCTLPHANDPSAIYNVQLTFAKKTYQILSQFKKTTYKEAHQVALTSDTFLTDQRNQMPPENFVQLLTDYRASSSINQGLITSQVISLELYAGQSIIDKALGQMAQQYMKSVADQLTIQTRKCTNSTTEDVENVDDFIDCTVEIRVDNVTDVQKILKEETMKPETDLKKYFQFKFSDNCKGDDVCTITIGTVQAKSKKAIFLEGEAEELEFEDSSTDTKPEEEGISLLMAKTSLEDFNIKAFDLCKNSPSCPSLTTCSSTGPSYKCICQFDKNNSVFKADPANTGTQNGAIVHKCLKNPEKDICTSYAVGENSTKPLYVLDSCNFNLEVNKTLNQPKVTLQYNCTKDGYSVANNVTTGTHGFVFVKNTCIDKYKHFCASHSCGKNGKCEVTKDNHATCSCNDGWMGDSCQTDKNMLFKVGLIVAGSVIGLIVLINASWCIVRFLRKKKTRSRVKHTNSIYLNRPDSRNTMEMNHYEMNGTYRRNESPTLPDDHLPPRFTVVPTDADDGKHRRNREDEERQNRAPASINANRVRTSRATEKEQRQSRMHTTATTKTKKSSTSGSKPTYTISSHREMSSDSSSSDSSIDLPPSRPPSPVPAVPSSSGSSSSSDNKPVILTRSMLLNGQSTTSKQTSFQYIPSNLRNRTEESSEAPRASGRASGGKAPYTVTNPAVTALQKATTEISSSRVKQRKGSRRDE